MAKKKTVKRKPAKRKRLILGKDFDGWAVRRNDTGPYLLTWGGAAILRAKRPSVSKGETAVRVKFVEVK